MKKMWQSERNEKNEQELEHEKRARAVSEIQKNIYKRQQKVNKKKKNLDCVKPSQISFPRIL